MLKRFPQLRDEQLFVPATAATATATTAPIDAAAGVAAATGCRAGCRVTQAVIDGGADEEGDGGNEPICFRIHGNSAEDKECGSVMILFICSAAVRTFADTVEDEENNAANGKRSAESIVVHRHPGGEIQDEIDDEQNVKAAEAAVLLIVPAGLF